MLKNIAILCGGNSSEFEISIKTADQIIESLKGNKEFNFFKVVIRFNDWEVLYNNEKYKINKENFTFEINSEIIKFDLVLPFVHGTPVEDGKIQNYFDILGIKYSSSSPLVSALTFSKYYCNKLLSSFNLNIAKSILITDLKKVDINYISNYISYPCFVKPNNSGSSFGVSKVKNKENLLNSIEKAFAEGGEVIIEEFLDGIEVTQGFFVSNIRKIIMPVIEISSSSEFFDFEAKYTDGVTEEIIPARINKELEKKCYDVTEKISNIFQFKGFVRIDYIIKNNEIYILEINTIPGMTKNSLIPKAIRYMNLNLEDLIIEIIKNS
ncbi:D-alanine--D-alanine ligase [bacterium]|nr:D-alanine--D-alanine ligase [bacterium]